MGASEKMFFVLFTIIDARAPQTLRYWQCFSSLATMLHGMRPFIAQINAMTSKATQYRTAHATSSALFEIEIWRAVIIMMLISPPMLAAVPLHMFIKNPRNRNPHPTVSEASPWHLCAALYCAQTGRVLAWTTYRLPDEKYVVCKSQQGHRKYLGHLLSILLMVKYASARPAAPLQDFRINDNKGALAWAEKHRCASLASQYA